MNEPVIEFKGYSIDNLNYSKKTIESSKNLKLKDGNGLGIRIEQGLTEDLKKANLIITVDFVDQKKPIYIHAKILSLFEINGIDSKEEIMKFLSVNGTAIVYPYIRSIVSMVSSLDSGSGVVLPTINTTQFGK